MKKNMGEREKIVGYCRVSTGKQDNGLRSQQAAIENYAAAEGKEIVEVFEEMESGKENGRMVLVKAMSRAKAEGATLVISKLDRLSRDVEFLFGLRRTGVDFLALDLPDFNSLTLSIFAGMAQHEREIISERTKAGLAEARRKGATLGGLRFCRNSTETNWNRATRAAAAARKEKAMVANIDFKPIIEEELKTGMSFGAIAKKLNSYKIRTTTGKSWTPMQVSRVSKMFGLQRKEEPKES